MWECLFLQSLSCHTRTNIVLKTFSFKQVGFLPALIYTPLPKQLQYTLCFKFQSAPSSVSVMGYNINVHIGFFWTML